MGNRLKQPLASNAITRAIRRTRSRRRVSFFSAGTIAELIERPGAIESHTRDTKIEVYRELPWEQAESLRELFGRIVAGRVPLLYNCSAGKDRTGIAAALLLTLLGVPREIIEEYYLLTNQAIDGLIAFMADSPRYRDIVHAHRERAMPLLRAELDYLATSFAAIERKHGSVGGYLREVIRLSEADCDKIRERLLA